MYIVQFVSMVNWYAGICISRVFKSARILRHCTSRHTKTISSISLFLVLGVGPLLKKARQSSNELLFPAGPTDGVPAGRQYWPQSGPQHPGGQRPAGDGRQAVWSTLIGRAPTLLRSHWSRASLVMLAPAVLCHKEPARRIQSPLLGVFCLLLAGSLWHKG